MECYCLEPKICKYLTKDSDGMYYCKKIEHHLENGYAMLNHSKHCGMIAQDVKKSVEKFGKTTEDFAGITYDEETDRYGLRYNEFVAPLIKSVQELSAKNIKLEDKVERLEDKVALLEKKIDALLGEDKK